MTMTRKAIEGQTDGDSSFVFGATQSESSSNASSAPTLGDSFTPFKFDFGAS
jgi:hypothetical protein